MKKIILSLAVITVALSSCTDNVRAKNWGGSMTIEVPPGNKVTNITWKKGDLWYSYRPFQEGESPVTQYFVEESSFGIMEGSVKFVESK